MNIHVCGSTAGNRSRLRLQHIYFTPFYFIAIGPTVSKMAGAVSNSDTQPSHRTVHTEFAHIVSFSLRCIH